MFFLPCILIASLVAGTTPAAVRIGLAALCACVVATLIAVLTGNWLIAYLGAAAGPFGLVTLLVHAFQTRRA
jgi:hypothetical protein